MYCTCILWCTCSLIVFLFLKCTSNLIAFVHVFLFFPLLNFSFTMYTFISSLSILSFSPPLQSLFLCLSLLLSLLSYTCSSYIHAEWATFDKLLRGDKRFDEKVKHYKQKQAQLGIFANVHCTCKFMQHMYVHVHVRVRVHVCVHVHCTRPLIYMYSLINIMYCN